MGTKNEMDMTGRRNWTKKEDAVDRLKWHDAVNKLLRISLLS